jgi:serine O-acetyltransferase
MSLLSEYLDADWARLTTLAGAPERRRRLATHFSPRFAPVALLRIAHALHVRGWTRLAKVPSLLNFLLFGLEVPARLDIGKGLVLMHTQGTILGASRIGANVTVYQQVTLGARTADFAYTLELRPVVEDGVTLTAGAKILGALTLHEGCTVGANAVVLADVPANALAVGVPARIVPAADGEAVSPGGP